MNLLAIGLVLFSTFMHASWNLLARHQRSEHAFFRRMLIASLVMGLFPASVSEAIVRSIPPRAWIYVLVSGISCGFYYFFLASAYHLGDFTTVYPVARALPVILVGLVDLIRGRYPTALGWVGMFLVAMGCVLSPLERFKEIAMNRYINRTSVWMVLTALGTVVYTVFDKFASEVVSPGPATAARYGYIFFVISGLSYILFLFFLQKRESNVVVSETKQLEQSKKAGKQAEEIGWWMPLIASVLNFGAYWLVLWVYQLASRASYIVAFRQFSIVVGVVLAFFIYKEKGVKVRLTAVLIITTGLVIIGLWGK